MEQITISPHQKELNGNIDNWSVLERVRDNKEGMEGIVCTIVGKTMNSIEVLIPKRPVWDKDLKQMVMKGIDATNYFYIKDFEKRFSKLQP